MLIITGLLAERLQPVLSGAIIFLIARSLNTWFNLKSSIVYPSSLSDTGFALLADVNPSSPIFI